MARIYKNIIDKVVAPYKGAKKLKVKDMHAQGEAAVPVEDVGAKSDEVLAAFGAKQTDPLAEPKPDSPVIDEPVQPIETPEPEPTGPTLEQRPPVGADEVQATPAPTEPRTRARNINQDYLGVENLDDVGRVLEAQAKRMGYGDEPARTFETVKGEVRGNQMEILKDVLAADVDNNMMLSDAQLLAARDVLTTIADEVAELSQKIAAGKGTPEEFLRYDQASAQSIMLHEYLSGKVRRAAQALNSMKITTQVMNTADAMKMAEATGRDVVERAQAVNELIKRGDMKPKDILEAVNKSTPVRDFVQSVVALRSASLLTSLRTHLVNIVSNLTFSAARTMVTTPVAAGVGRVRTMRTGSNPERVVLKESIAELTGLVHSIPEALSIAKTTWTEGVKTGEYISMYGGRKIDEIAENNPGMGSAFNAMMGGMSDGYIAKGANGYQRGVEALSFGGLTAGDDLFKTSNYRAKVYGLAQRDASLKGLTGQAEADHITNILSDMSHEIHQRAMREAEQRTFTNRDDVADVLHEFAKTIVKSGSQFPLIRWFVPYVMTPTALLDRAIKWSFAAPLNGKWRAAVQAGGPEADMAIAEMTVGSSLMVVMGALTAGGLVTGGGPSRRDDPTGAIRKELQATGWQPYSVRTPDGYVRLDRALDPIMIGPLAAATAIESAQYAKGEAEFSDYLIGATYAMGNKFTETAYMEGIEQLIKLLNGDLNYTQFFARESTTLVPNVVKDFTKVARLYTDAEGTMARAPRSSDLATQMMLEFAALDPTQTTMIARYWDGRPVTAGGGDMTYYLNLMQPIMYSHNYGSKGRPGDPATAALIDARVPVGALNSEVTIDPDSGASVDLLTLPNGHKLYSSWVEKVGHRRRQAVESLVNTQEYQDASAEGLTGPNSQFAMALTQAVREGRTAGTEEFFAEIRNPDFDWSGYEEETRRLLTGERLGELYGLQADEALLPEELEELQDLGVKGVPTRGPKSPPMGTDRGNVEADNEGIFVPQF